MIEFLLPHSKWMVSTVALDVLSYSQSLPRGYGEVYQCNPLVQLYYAIPNFTILYHSPLNITYHTIYPSLLLYSESRLYYTIPYQVCHTTPHHTLPHHPPHTIIEMDHWHNIHTQYVAGWMYVYHYTNTKPSQWITLITVEKTSRGCFWSDERGKGCYGNEWFSLWSANTGALGGRLIGPNLSTQHNLRH